MKRHDLSDQEWRLLEPPLPSMQPQRGGRWADHRTVINGVFFRTRTSLAISGTSAASANADSSADLEVKLSSVASLLLVGARYTVTITNHGPDQLDSATVVVRLDPRAWSTLGDMTCPLDRTTATLTCTFGTLPAGASASLKPFVYYDINENRATLRATATRTASTPADPNGANDSDPTTCWYEWSVWGSSMRCAG